MTQKYLVFDVETENLALFGKNKVWNLSYLVCDNNQILEEHDYYPWWPNLNVSPGAAQVTKFNYNEYKQKASDPKEILDKFESRLYNKEFISICHNSYNFDAYLHNLYRRELGLKPDWSWLERAIDTVSLSKAYKLGIKLNKNEDRTAFMFRVGGIVQKNLKTNLTQMAKDFNIEFPFDMCHKSIYDCRLNWLVWNKLKNHFEI